MPDQFEIAYAKINLALHVRARRMDGYHDLETLFAFVDCGDRLSVEPADGLSLELTGPFCGGLSNGNDNLVMRAAQSLARYAAVSAGAQLSLEKNLPVASGIGGGSADAAATVRMLNQFWKLGLSARELEGIVAPLGADIPACVQSRTSYGAGTGTELSMVDGSTITGLAVLLINPLKPVSTASVFKAWDGHDRGPLANIEPMAAAIAGRNDLETPAITLCLDIAEILSSLRDFAPIMARMSGSGATCFALFDSDKACEDAAQTISAARPEWWTLKGRMR